MDLYKNREKVEWTNTWIENCNEKDTQHWLLIGDSVARGFRGSLSCLLENKSVDFIGTSSSFEDPCFYNIFNAFFDKNVYSYSKILIMIGGNHGFYIDTYNNPQDCQKYKTLFSDFTGYLSKYCKDITILLTTPNRTENNLENWNEKINREIITRNNIQTSIAKDCGYKIIDLYNLVYKNNYKYQDIVHVAGKKTNSYIAQYIYDCLNNKNTDISEYKNDFCTNTNKYYTYKLFGLKIKFSRKKLLDNIDNHLLSFSQPDSN